MISVPATARSLYAAADGKLDRRQAPLTDRKSAAGSTLRALGRIGAPILLSPPGRSNRVVSPTKAFSPGDLGGYTVPGTTFARRRLQRKEVPMENA
jgi:hypothetical protein